MKNNTHNQEPTFNEMYEKNEDFFGHPYQELQDFFKAYSNKGSIFDLGCGQGRDAIFLSSIGYNVTALDQSQTGIDQMLAKAKKLNLDLKGFSADVFHLELKEKYDIILLDMLLHSFNKAEQIVLLKKCSLLLNQSGIFCIVYPNDLSQDYFIDLMNNLIGEYKIIEKIIINDVPKVEGEDEEFTFEMIIVKKIF